MAGERFCVSATWRSARLRFDPRPGGAVTAPLSQSRWHERHLPAAKFRFCMYMGTIRPHHSMLDSASEIAASCGCFCRAGVHKERKRASVQACLVGACFRKAGAEPTSDYRTVRSA
jgi:hypothetical protein